MTTLNQTNMDAKHVQDSVAMAFNEEIKLLRYAHDERVIHLGVMSFCRKLIALGGNLERIIKQEILEEVSHDQMDS